jgi:hypothetical protein
MAMELLHELAAHPLPLTVKDEAVAEQIRLLRAANFVAAVTSPPGSSAPFASIFSITRRGREALRLDRQRSMA